MAQILIYGDIGWDVTAKGIRETLAETGNEDLEIHINSYGGLVHEGWAIYNALIQHRNAGNKVSVMIDGVAASIATIIALAADTVSIGEGASFMIHNAWSWGVGNAEQLKKETQLLEQIDDKLVTVYVNKTGLDEQQVRDLMTAETWFTDDEAVDMGFCDSKAEAPKMAAMIDATRFSKRNSINYMKPEENLAEDKGFFNKLSAFFDKQDKAAQNKIKELEDNLLEAGTQANTAQNHIKNLEEKVTELEAQLAEARAVETVVAGSGDPEVDGIPKKTPFDLAADQLANSLPK